MNPPTAPWTCETWNNGKQFLIQPKNGYRYTIDPFILCSGLSLPRESHVLDIGTGCGIIPLILSKKMPGGTKITGVEIQENLAYCAAQNIQLNGLSDNINIIHQDINTLVTRGSLPMADLILSNPPYKKKGTGRLNPDSARAVARHEIHLTVEQLFSNAEHLLTQGGQFRMIFPADRVQDIKTAAQMSGLTLTQLQFIHRCQSSPAFRVIAVASRDHRESCSTPPPVFLYHPNGMPTKTYERLFTP